MDKPEGKGIFTREGRAWVAWCAMSILPGGEAKAEALAWQAADTEPDNGHPWCAWHALSQVQKTICYCAPCWRAREKGGLIEHGR